MLTVIAEKGEEVIPELQNLWLMKYNQYRRFDRHVNQEEVRKAVSIVFGFTILAVNTSRHPFYNFTLTWNLTCIVADNTPEGWSHTLDRIVSLQMPDGWFDRFVEEDPWDGNSLSGQLPDISSLQRQAPNTTIQFVKEQHNHNCQQFMGEMNSPNFITQSKDEEI